MDYKFLDSTIAIVVIYNEKIENSKTLTSLDKGLSDNNILDLIIYDNSKICQEVENINFKKFRIKYIHNPNNPGVSFAYNYGAEQAKKSNKRWLLLLDQDTYFNEDFFEKANTAIAKFNHIKLFAPILKLSNNVILSPCKFSFHGRHLETITSGNNSFYDNSPLNSGIIVCVNAFLEVGGYNIKVPLDLSDHQFIEKFKQRYKSYFVVNSIGLQNFSAIEDNKQKQIIRFKYYCKGVFNFETNIVFKKQIMILFLVLKTIKKSIKYSTFGFFTILFREAKMFLNDLIFNKN